MKSISSLLMAAVAVAITLCSPLSLAAQDNIWYNIAAKAQYDGQYVRLRWSPMDFPTWRQGVSHGYIIERYTVGCGGQPNPAGEYEASLIHTEIILPRPEAEWETFALSNDLAGVAAGCLYGDSLDLLPPGPTTIMTIQNKSKETENRFGFSLFAADQDFTIATMMGLGYEDEGVVAGCEYVYFVKMGALPSDYIEKGGVTQEGFAQIKTDTAYVLPKPSGLKGIPGDSMAILTWTKDNAEYTSYVVEKSTDSGSTFQALNDMPLVHAGLEEGSSAEASAQAGSKPLAVFVDSLAANGVAYIYRVRGRSPFGVLSPPSDTVQVTGKPGPLQVQMSIRSVEEVTAGQLTVTWGFPADQQSKITGFDVLHGPHPEGPFTKLNASLLPVSARTFVHTAPQALNYYVVNTHDLNGYELNTFPMFGQPNDTVAPPRPVITQGVCDASGLVTLSWAHSTAPDVAGYQVSISNISNAEFAVVSPALLNDTIFRYGINLNTLSEDMYFSVQALDFRYNRSPMAVPILIKRPDIIPPAAPLITTVNATTTGVYFSWNASSSDDVVRYEFQRQKVGAPGWGNIKVFTPDTYVKDFVDSTASKRNWYRYRLVAIDEAGNRGGSKAIKAKPINDGLRDPIINLTGSVVQFSTLADVSISWRYPKDVDLVGFQIYRGFDRLAVRSHKFFPHPMPQGSDIMFAPPDGNNTLYAFIDKDTDFSIPEQTTFTVFNNINATPNKAVPPPTTNANISQFAVPNPNLPLPKDLQPTLIYYWVMAQFADGSTSPLAGFVEVEIP